MNCIPRYMLVELIILAFYFVIILFTRKYWGKNPILTTVICIFLIGYPKIYTDSVVTVVLSVFLSILILGQQFYIVVKMIIRQGDAELFQQKSAFISLGITILLTTVLIVTGGFPEKKWTLKLISECLTATLIAPFLEELCVHQIIYRSIEKKEKYRFYIIAGIISLCITLLHPISLSSSLVTFVFFFSLFHIQYESINSVIWKLVSFHSGWNFISGIIAQSL